MVFMFVAFSRVIRMDRARVHHARQSHRIRSLHGQHSRDTRVHPRENRLFRQAQVLVASRLQTHMEYREQQAQWIPTVNLQARPDRVQQQIHTLT